jgi:hypothetical protein
MNEITYIRIVSCNDPHRWYSKHIGEDFPLIAEESVEYKTRQPAGYINFILKKDSFLIKLLT